MDNSINSTQRFGGEEYEEEREIPSLPYDHLEQPANEYTTQAFGISAYNAEATIEEEPSSVQSTRAFPLCEGPTQAFSVGTFDEDPSDDPMLYGSSHAALDSTQQFPAAEFATLGSAVNVSGTSDSDYGLLSSGSQQFVGGLEVVETSGGYDEHYDGEEQEIAGEEIIDGDDAASGNGVLEMDEIASPDPVDEEEEFEQEEAEEAPHVKRTNRISSEDEQEEEQGEQSNRRRPAKVVPDDGDQSDGAVGGNASDDDAEKKSEVGELIANIFGDSDDDAAVSDMEEGNDNEHTSKRVREKAAAASDSDTQDSDDLQPKVVAQDFVSDFDLMMERRRAENRRRYRKRNKDYDVISDVDDVIKDLISQMKHAAKVDNELNRQQKPALSKRKLMPVMVKQLKKSDLQSAFIEHDVVSVIADWLSPLPDGSLPALEIRTELLKVLQQFPTLDHQILKTSGIGRAVMILYKHPKEVKENKERAGKLINDWARPIFSLQSDYRSLSKEERIQRDYEHMPAAKKRRMSSMDSENKQKADAVQDEAPLRPGDKGWIGRARVPQPSTKDYVVRPKSNVEAEFRNASSKRGSSLMERKIREIKERTKPKKSLRAIGVSIEGRKMM